MREEAQQKARGRLAPLAVISLPLKQFRNSHHSSFQNNSTPIFPLAAERKIARRGPAESQETSGTIGSYLIATKAIPQLTTLGFSKYSVKKHGDLKIPTTSRLSCPNLVGLHTVT